MSHVPVNEPDQHETAMRVYRRLGLTSPNQLEQGVFGMHLRRGETLLAAMERWYAEFDDARQADRAEIARLSAENTALHATVAQLTRVGTHCENERQGSCRGYKAATS